MHCILHWASSSVLQIWLDLPASLCEVISVHDLILLSLTDSWQNTINTVKNYKNPNVISFDKQTVFNQ